LLALARQASPDTPAGVRIAFADAWTRSGRPREARRVLDGIVAEHAGPPAIDWTHLTLGWLDMVAGEFRHARGHYEHADETGLGHPVAPVALGLIDAAEHQTDRAIATLRAAATAPGVPPPLRPLARLGVAYAHYWTRAYEVAAAEFDEVARTDAGSILADDAAYGAAWARWRAGAHDEALERLRALASPTELQAETKRTARALVDLEPRAITRGAMKRYRRVPLGSPADQVLALFDVDGRELARAALADVADAPSTVAVPAGDRALARPATEPALQAEPSARPRPVAGTSFAALVLVIGIVAGSAALWWLLARRHSRDERG